jgi:hypothetical protein
MFTVKAPNFIKDQETRQAKMLPTSTTLKTSLNLINRWYCTTFALLLEFSNLRLEFLKSIRRVVQTLEFYIYLRDNKYKTKS